MVDKIAPYAVVLFFIVMGTMTWINPDKGILQKWLYWAVVPLLIAGILSLAFNNIIGGIGAATPFIALLYVGYFRYRKF